MTYLFQSSIVKKKNWTVYILSIFIILLDQVTKLIARIFLKGTGPYSGDKTLTIIEHVFKFTYVENPGMAFGIRIGNDTFFTIFTSITSLIILYLLYKLRSKQFSVQLALALILAGAIGNLFDRIIYGKVIDFIYIELIRWPVFNIADVAVTVGMVIWITHVLIHNEDKKQQAEEEPDIWIDGKKIPSDEVIR